MSLADVAPEPLTSVEVVDSHTEGEPTRVIIGGWPQPRGRTMLERCDWMREHQDRYRLGVVTEPRGHDAVVGALLTPSESPGSATGVVFFNDVGYLGMCGHGLIGVARTLAFLHPEQRKEWEAHGLDIDTPAGTVHAWLDDFDDSVEIRNVEARVFALDVHLVVPGIGEVIGDIAYGGNWFFLTSLNGASLTFENRAQLLDATMRIREELRSQNIVGDGGAEIDHIELFGPPIRPDADSRNFVLCPGAAFDRSPCGTGTSAKLAVLRERGMLEIGEPWRQESITGSLFVARLDDVGDRIVPFVKGSAHVIARSTLIFHPADPFRFGFSGNHSSR